MKKRLTISETAAVGSMLFGLFFGAGNLIFPVFMGQAAGANVWRAVIGFLITGVGIPLLGVAALGMSRSDGLFQMSSKVGRGYGYFFTILLYLTIGPFFAIPRCASTSFSVGIKPMIDDGTAKWLVWIFSLLFFAAVLWFSLRPGKILTWVGKILTPLFLAALGLLIVAALISPIGSAGDVAPEASYESGAVFQGFLDGYNTMDALAGLAFGIVVITAIRGLGVEDPAAIAGNTITSGFFGCVIMAVIYAALALIGAQSRTVYPLSADGGEALYVIATHYFGKVGGIILAVIVTLACLKTAVGLITSCGEMFRELFPRGPKYPVWAVGFCVVSFLISTIGLSAIIGWSLPVLMFLYPLAMTIIMLALSGRLFGHDRRVYACTTAFTLIAAIPDLTGSLPHGLSDAPVIRTVNKIGDMLPLADIGLGWVCPALVGFAAWLVWHLISKARSKHNSIEMQ